MTLRHGLWTGFDGLEPDRRTAFVLTQILGCSYKETAQICGCPVGTVRSRVARARDTLLQLTRPDALEEGQASSRAGTPRNR